MDERDAAFWQSIICASGAMVALWLLLMLVVPAGDDVPRKKGDTP